MHKQVLQWTSLFANTEAMLCVSAANERTFLSWLHMAITMGGITTALTGFAVQSQNAAGELKPLCLLAEKNNYCTVLRICQPSTVGAVVPCLDVAHRVWRSAHGSSCLLRTSRWTDASLDYVLHSSAMYGKHCTSHDAASVCVASCPQSMDFSQ